MDLTKQADVVSHMTDAESGQDWDRRADEVKQANGDAYPRFWWAAIIQSGLADRVAEKWDGMGSGIGLATFDKEGNVEERVYGGRLDGRVRHGRLRQT